MRLRALSIVVACLPVFAVAQATKSDSPGGQRIRLGDRAARFSENREKEWQEAYDFFKEHSPLRSAAFDKMPEERKGEFRPMIIGRYMAFRALGAQNSELQQLKIVQMKMEDHVYGLRVQLAEIENGGDGNADAVKQELKDVVGKLVDLRMEERKLRIARMEKLLEDERAELEEDQAHKDEMVRRQYERVLDSKGLDRIGEARPKRQRQDSEKPRREREQPK